MIFYILCLITVLIIIFTPLVRDAVGGWRTDRLDLVLGGDFDLTA